MSAASRSEHHLVLGHRTNAGEPALLLVPDGAGWGPPRLESEERPSSEVADLNRAARAALGVEVSVLRCLLDRPAPDGGPRQAIYELEAHASGWTPPAIGCWATAADLPGLALSRPEMGPMLAAWLEARRSGWPSAPGRDWTRPGWRAEAIAWVDGELGRLGLGAVREIEQLKVWEYSNVLRLATDAGVFYLKALCASAAREPVLVSHLAAAHGAAAPDVIAVDFARRWLLMRATPGPDLLDVSDRAVWQEAAQRFARIQIEWSGRVEELRALGCPHWPLDALAREIGPMLADGRALMAPSPAGLPLPEGQPLAEGLPVPEGLPLPEGLTHAEIAELRRRAPTLVALCAELAGLGVPDSIEHGDLWGTNVIAGPDGPVFIDWEDATVAHPFLSPSLLLLTLPYSKEPAGMSDAAARIREAYLEPWHASGPLRGWPIARLEHAFELAQRVAMIHYAVQFRLGLPLVETSWWVHTFTPFFLRRVLA